MNNGDAKQRFIFMMALGLTFLLALNYLYPQRPAAPPPAANQAAVHPAPPPPPSPSGAPDAAKPGAEADTAGPAADYTVIVRSGGEEKNGNGYEATFSSAGGGLTRHRLLGHYRVPGNETDENRILMLNRMAAGRDSLRIDTMTSGPSRQEQARHVMRNTRFHLAEVPAGAKVSPAPGPEVREGDNLVFRAVVDDWEIIRTYRFPKAGGADFTLNFDVEWKNLSDANRVLGYNLVGPAGLVADDDSAQFGIINILTARQASETSATVDIERRALSELVSATDMYDFDNRAGLAWVGAKNRFFTAIMSASSESLADSNGGARLLFAGDPDFVPAADDIRESLKSQPTVSTQRGAVPAFEEVALAVEPGTVAAGGTHKASYLLYAGPAVDTVMEAADPRLRGIVSYTISYLDFISRWLVQLLTFLDGILGNYGLAIIAVTVIIKCLLHPLNRKSYVSMNRMQKLAPQLKEIQKKYAGDRGRMQAEMQKFYKEHGVSMAGGCLPIFLQLPIFLALYGAFSQGFSMRHAAFIPGWIQDLSKPDSVYDLGWQIPLLSSSQISLLPIIYLVLQYIMMSLQPKPSDPQQAQQQKIMKFMPLMFVFIFYAMPAGLVLYFTISALAGVVENWWMRNRLLPRLGLGNTPAAVETAAATARAGTGAAAVPSDANKKKRKK